MRITEVFSRFRRIHLSTRISLLLAALVGAVLLFGGQTAMRFVRSGSSGNQPLAVVDGKGISLAAFQAEMTRRGGEAAFSSPQQRRSLLDEMIRVEVLASNATKAGYADNPEVRHAIDQILADRYAKDTIDDPLASLQVTEGEIQDYYHGHIGQFTSPEAAHGAVIFVAVPQNVSEDQRQVLLQRAQKAHELAAAKPGAPNFADLAAQYSDDADTRSQGGDIGWVSEGEDNPRWEKAVMTAVFDLDNPGQVSAVITTGAGFYIVKLLEDRPAAVRGLPEVHNTIRQQLIRAARQDRAAKLYAAALSKVPVSVNEAGLAAMEAAEKAVVEVPHAPSQPQKGDAG
jgi:parvulin-like peptidyl-prolyl isomerase